ncbi:MAG: YitT family protein, partial [Bacteroidales bacterium]|nr:YitT family protein [Bacteroidales bacterium]
MNDIIKSSFDALKTKQFWKEFSIITLGMLFTAMAIYYFLVPSKLIIGTVSGLAIVVSEVLAAVGIQIKVSMM